MNKLKASVLAAAVLFGVAVTADASAQRRHGGGGGHRHHAHGHKHHHGHGHRSGVAIGIGFGSPFWYGAPYPYYRPYYRPYYYPYPVAVGVPAVTEYIEQPAPSAAAPAPGYWYYCNESQAYYPQVQQCAGPWERVAPQPPS